MALEGNNGSGNFSGYDGQKGCGQMISGISALGYPPAPCWQSGIGIGNYGLSHSQTIPSTPNPPNGVPLGGVGSSFCLDDIFTFPVHVMDTVDMVSDSQQMVKLESQLIVPNFMGANNKKNNKDQGASNGEEPTSSQSTGESQSSRKRKNQANDNNLLKSLPSLADKNGEGETKVKQPRSTEAGVNKEAAKPNSKQTEEKSKTSEAPKDFIHVRARRGQATDSHSLAERVRREKISERMKLLQDLVPGCNKITGKAVMLDEIINYVQSLQRQVEFLSMKLEAVNPRMELSTESFLPKHMVEQSEMASYAPDSTIAYPQFSQPQWSSMQVGVSYEMEHQQFLPNAEVANKKIMYDKFPLMDSFGDAKNPNVWEEELQTLVRTGSTPNVSFASHNFHGPFATSPTNI